MHPYKGRPGVGGRFLRCEDSVKKPGQRIALRDSASRFQVLGPFVAFPFLLAHHRIAAKNAA